VNKDKAAGEVLRASAMRCYVPSPQRAIAIAGASAASNSPNPVATTPVAPKSAGDSPDSDSPQILVPATPDVASTPAAGAKKRKRKVSKHSSFSSDIDTSTGTNSPNLSPPPVGKKGRRTKEQDMLRRMEKQADRRSKRFFQLLEAQKENQDRLTNAMIDYMSRK
jgi:hypothetical protein